MEYTLTIPGPSSRHLEGRRSFESYISSVNYGVMIAVLQDMDFEPWIDLGVIPQGVPEKFKPAVIKHMREAKKGYLARKAIREDVKLRERLETEHWHETKLPAGLRGASIGAIAGLALGNPALSAVLALAGFFGGQRSTTARKDILEEKVNNALSQLQTQAYNYEMHIYNTAIESW